MLLNHMATAQKCERFLTLPGQIGKSEITVDPFETHARALPNVGFEGTYVMKTDILQVLSEY